MSHLPPEGAQELSYLYTKIIYCLPGLPEEHPYLSGENQEIVALSENRSGFAVSTGYVNDHLILDRGPDMNTYLTLVARTL